ncbi:MAG: hypothetical protein IPO63_08510 [Bacteroidetes bacterium]|nr:hypothetical protein [Bacteroidota bacterium]
MDGEIAKYRKESMSPASSKRADICIKEHSNYLICSSCSWLMTLAKKMIEKQGGELQVTSTLQSRCYIYFFCGEAGVRGRWEENTEFEWN